MDPKQELQSFIRDLEIALPEGEETFYNIVQSANRLLKLSHKDMAEIFDVSFPTAMRWLAGENLPHPAMRKGVYSTFLGIAKHILEEHDGEA